MAERQKKKNPKKNKKKTLEAENKHLLLTLINNLLNKQAASARSGLFD